MTAPTTITGARFEHTCDCCLRPSSDVRGSVFHGDHKLCSECFGQWYDPDSGSFDNCDPVQLGNYVRGKHGLPPVSEAERGSGRAGG